MPRLKLPCGWSEVPWSWSGAGFEDCLVVTMDMRSGVACDELVSRDPGQEDACEECTSVDPRSPSAGGPVMHCTANVRIPVTVY